jgi:transcriptional regulator GlxA family with amidase domain
VSPRTIGLIVFDEMAWAEFGGALETFTRVHIPTDYGYGCRCYNVVTIGLTTEPCHGRAGLLIKPDVDFRTAPELDTLIVCGGEPMRAPTLSRKVAKWLTYRAPTTRRIASLGMGIYPLAMTGLLDGREVATHWRFAKDVGIRFPALRVHSNRLYIKDGPFYTCAGGTAAVDFALSLVEADFGRTLALKLARDLLIHSQRTGGEEQYSEPLQFQVEASDRYRLADLVTWILSHLGENLTVDALARRVCTSPRNFARLFNHTFGKTPAEFVAGARMTEARRRLLVPRAAIKDVATSLGYKSAAVFSTAFERFVGMRPTAYRVRLGVEDAHVTEPSSSKIEFLVNDPAARYSVERSR